MNISTGDHVKLLVGATNYNGGMLPTHILKMTWNVRSVAGDRIVLGKSVENANIVLNIPVHRKYLTLVD